MRSGKYTIEELTLWKGISKELDEYKTEQIHTKAIKKAQEEFEDYAPTIGSKVSYVVIKPKKITSDGILKNNDDFEARKKLNKVKKNQIRCPVEICSIVCIGDTEDSFYQNEQNGLKTIANSSVEYRRCDNLLVDDTCICDCGKSSGLCNICKKTGHGKIEPIFQVPGVSDHGKLVAFLDASDEIDIEHYINTQIIIPSLRILSVFDVNGVPIDRNYLEGKPVQMKLF